VKTCIRMLTFTHCYTVFVVVILTLSQTSINSGTPAACDDLESILILESS
jgi:hypothetical protein